MVGRTYGSLAVLTGGMIIAGNVGIGTTSPQAKLEVDGDILSDTVGYDSEGAYRYCKINGIKTKVYTKYLTGTLKTP